MPPTYRQRLRREGLTLAGMGLLGTVALLVTIAQARRGPASTVGQLIVLAALLAWLGPRSVRRAITTSRPRSRPDLGSGEPTPLWQLPVIVAALSALAGLLGGWDAGVRVTGGCVLVGLTQAVVLERLVAIHEQTTLRTYFRVTGSRILRGTRLGYV
ncbi:MAG: hypothetical protein ACR2LV_09665 [Solirubrobacteraceae bacterium]